MRTVVAVLRGGPSADYDVSLKTGAGVLEALDREKYEPRDIFISKGGEWHLHGVGVAPERALQGADVAWNALHGHYGEDGQAQRLLERLGVPYTGSGPFASSLAFHKGQTREVAKRLGVKVAHGVVVESGNAEEIAHQLFRTFPHPAIVKPVTGGFSRGIAVADSFHSLQRALEQAFEHSPEALVEEYIRGKDASVGVLDNFRNEKTYALIPSPAAMLSHAQKSELTALAKQMHQALDLGHYAEHDFVLSKRGIYYLEVNTQPDLHKSSSFVQALHSVGAKFSDFLDHVIQLARKPK